MASLMPNGKQQYFDNNGDPLVGGKVYTYAAGTSTPLATYTDTGGGTPNANPVILDSRGEASIFWSSDPYKVVLKTSADVTVWTQDNVRIPLPNDSVDVRWFGAVGDGVTDDTAAIQAALNHVSSNSNGGEVNLGDGRYLIDSADLTIKRYCTLRGSFERLSTSSKDWTQFPSTLIVNPAYTIKQDAGSQVVGCCIIRKGMPASVTDGEASFSGTAITLINADTFTSRNAIMGFTYGIYNPGNSNYPRPVIEWNMIDCTNGIDIAYSADISRIQNNHIFPFTSNTNGDPHLRNGVGIALRNIHDWTMLAHNYVYAHETGYLLDDVNSVTLYQCAYDAPLLSLVSAPRTSIALKVTGSATENTAIGFQAAGADIGVYLDVTDANPKRTLTLVSPALWAHQSHNIKTVSGRVHVHGGVIRKQDTSQAPQTPMDPKGLTADGGNASIHHSHLSFKSITTDTNVLNGGSIRAILTDDNFSVKETTSIDHYVRGPSGGSARIYLDNTDYAGQNHIDFLSSNVVRLVAANAETWRATATGLGVGTGIPRANFHSHGNSIIGLGSTGVASTSLDDNTGGQTNMYLDESSHVINFKTIYSGTAGDTGRAVKTGTINLLRTDRFVGKTWLALGDSITAVAGGNSYVPNAALYLGVTATNAALGGTRMAYRAADSEAIRNASFPRITAGSFTAGYSLITVAFGINDAALPITLGVLGSTDETEFYGGMHVGYANILAANPSATVVFVLPVYRDVSNAPGDSAADAYRSAIIDFCTAKNLPYIDFHGIPGINTQNTATYQTDGLHMTATGGARLSRLLAGAIAAIW